MANKVPLPVIKRLPRYHRYLADLRREGVATVSSSELAGTSKLRWALTAAALTRDKGCAAASIAPLSKAVCKAMARRLREGNNGLRKTRDIGGGLLH